MNPEELLHAFLEGTLDEASSVRLRNWIKASPENLRTFTGAVMFEQQLRRAVCARESSDAVHSLLEPVAGGLAMARGRARDGERGQALVEAHTGASGPEPGEVPAFAAVGVGGEGRLRARWFQGRPLAAAVAGLVLGLCSASLVYGVVSSRVVATASRLSSLMDGGFESASGRLPSGFPRQYGVWSGDAAEVVSAEGLKPGEGRQLLRFLRAEGDAAVPDSEASACDICQLVDLRALRKSDASLESTLEASASFLDARAEGGERVRFTLRIMAYAGDPAAIRAEWPLTIRRAVAFGARHVESVGGAPESWRTLAAKIALPPDADFAIIQIHAWKPTPRGQAAEFGRQFADDVRVTLTTQPKLPVRVARR